MTSRDIMLSSVIAKISLVGILAFALALACMAGLGSFPHRATADSEGKSGYVLRGLRHLGELSQTRRLQSSVYLSEIQSVGAEGGEWDISGDNLQSFVEHRVNGFVTSVKVYQDETRRRRGARRRTPIKGISVAYDGESTEHAHGTTSGSYKQLVMQLGETVTELSISNNPDNLAIPGFVKIVTSSGQRLEVGEPGGSVNVASLGSGFLSGFSGSTKNHDNGGGSYPVLVGLHFLVYKPFSETLVTNMRYVPDLSLQQVVTSPKEMMRRDYCNPTSDELPSSTSSREVTLTLGNTGCFDISDSFTVGASVKISGGIPGLVDMESTAHWENVLTIGKTNCNSEEQLEKTTFTFPDLSIPPRTFLRYTYYEWSGELQNQRYEADLEFHFQDGNIDPIIKAVSGAYTGSSQIYAREVWSELDEATCTP